MSDSQCIVHLLEGLLGLLEEAEHNRLAKLPVVLIIVHLQDLLEGQNINAVAEIWQTDGALFALYCAWSALVWVEGSGGVRNIRSSSSSTYRVIGFMTCGSG